MHNCMVDSGATNTVMPNKIVDLLDFKYEPLEKGVVHLDGSSVKTLGVVKNADFSSFMPKFLNSSRYLCYRSATIFCPMSFKRFYSQNKWIFFIRLVPLVF